MELILSSNDAFLRKGEPLPSKGEVEIEVKPGLSRFSFLGFGGAFTESAAHVFASLSPENQEKAIKACFSKEGLCYRYGRTSIGSCDFSLGEYDYVRNGDLSTFSLEHEEKEILPLLRRAKEEAGELTLCSSTWSPLAAWKDNASKCHGGKLLKAHYEDQASYVARYRKAMEKKGFPILMLTVQNEPAAKQVWESCLYSPEEEGAMLRCLKEKNEDAEIYIHDHNRDNLRERAHKILSLCPHLSSGIAFHWYDRTRFSEIEEACKEFPDQRLIFTEGCVETLTNDFPGEMGSYSSFLRYLENYIRDLNSGCTLFLDWNLFLDPQGGPNHVGNFCEALLMGEGERLSLLPSYYAVYHLSHFIVKGAKPLYLESPDPNLLCCGAINPDGKKVYAFLNKAGEKTVSIDGVSFRLPEESGATLVL